MFNKKVWEWIVFTFNLGYAESVILIGLVGTVSVWTVVGQMTGKWNPRILFLGGVSADILSFYPQLKQYFGPNIPPTDWMFVGWGMWIIGSAINITFVEEFFRRFYKGEERRLLVIEESAFSIENCFFIIITVYVMMS